MVTFSLNGGKKDKIRPGDILGVLTGDVGLAGDKVGIINLFDSCAYVAIAREEAAKFKQWLPHGKLKNRVFKAA
ncbi:MAG: DbpA RNA binding domain-containing protein [Candidatus Lindowbacteria bacterium]|nr:DbpA RNA binding domain-containing protein [Candidatus Lindowbacteria bacterium]